MQKKPKVFVITPFREEFLALYEELKKVFSVDYEFTNAGDLDSQQNILQDIVEGINNAKVIIADLTGLNANVFYELGLAHAMNKKVIIITQDSDELPFDIKSYRVNEYSLQFNKMPKLIDTLRMLLAGAINGSIKYGNPVSDFTSPQIDVNQVETKNTEVGESKNDFELAATDDKGFLDYIEEIQENAVKMTDELLEMQNEMLDLKNSVESVTQEINQAKSSGNANTFFIKSVCRKIANPIDTLAAQINGHTQAIANSWNIIENNYLSLLDNRYARSEVNIDELRNSINELRVMQNSIRESNEKMKMFIYILKNTLGLERRLNQAITALITQFEYYLRETETMYSSIDRILSKSALVIHD